MPGPTLNPRHLSTRQKLVPAAAATLLVLAGVGLTGITAAQSAGAPFYICHANNADNNPYIVNSPSPSGDVDGHAKHTGPIWNATLKAQHIAWGDIIPPFTETVGNKVLTYPGLNWTAAGQAIHANGCNVPGPTPTPSVTVSATATPTATVSATATPTATVSATATPTVTATATATVTATATPTPTVAVTPTQEVLPTETALPVVVSLTVVKTNDANGDGTFSNTETAPAPGQSVPFQAVVTNTSLITVALDGLTDAIGAGSPFPVVCTTTLPATLAPGASATCDFTLTAASPTAGGSTTDVVTAAGHEPGVPGNGGSATDSSTVKTAPPASGGSQNGGGSPSSGGSQSGGTATPAGSNGSPAAGAAGEGELAFTGAPVGSWVLLGGSLIGLGALMVTNAGDRRRRTVTAAR